MASQPGTHLPEGANEQVRHGRTEDGRLLSGAGTFVADIALPRLCHAAFLRSPHAHAEITQIDVAGALAMPGVLAVLTGQDVARLGLGPLPCVMHPRPRPGSKLALPPHWPLAVEKVRHVGEPVAMVVAERVEIARDALESLAVDYEALPATVDVEAAGHPNAPQLHAEADRNICIRWHAGDESQVATNLARADHVIRLKIRNNRLASNPLEPRAAIGDVDPGSGRLTLYTASQGVHDLRSMLARDIFHLPETMIRLVTPDVGGSFGTKMYLYPEHVMVLVAARQLRRPVKWVCDRAEGFVTDNQARDQVTIGELGLTRDGEVLALRAQTLANLGAYLSGYGPAIPTEVGTRAFVGPYRTPAIYIEVEARFTNTVPVDAYRGAGRPEATFVLERLFDMAARELGIAPEELRRRNIIRPTEMPYLTPLGFAYDSGDFEANLRAALELAEWDSFPARRSAAAGRGLLAGIGLSSYVEPCGGEREQRADVRVQPDATVTVLVGSQSTGMGHETAFTSIVSARLGLPAERVRIIQGDSDAVPFGRWTSGSRTAAAGGSALSLALDRVIEKARHVAAHLMEVAEADIEYCPGVFTVRGTDRRLTLTDVCSAAFDQRKMPEGLELGLDHSAIFRGYHGTYPGGSHICEVEVDPLTGVVRIVRYVAVDDFGRVIAPFIVEGQVHGGLVQGIGQALLEHCVYDCESGQLLNGSFMDYCLPRADDLPFLCTARTEVPCLTNPLGVKGCGESGAIAAPPAVINAVVDALRDYGVRHIDMPATPERVWRAMSGRHSGAEPACGPEDGGVH